MPRTILYTKVARITTKRPQKLNKVSGWLSVIMSQMLEKMGHWMTESLRVRKALRARDTILVMMLATFSSMSIAASIIVAVILTSSILRSIDSKLAKARKLSTTSVARPAPILNCFWISLQILTRRFAFESAFQLRYQLLD